MKGHRHLGYISDVYDLFGVHHLAQLRAARAECDFLIVGVLADDVAAKITGNSPVIPFEERLAITRSMRVVDAAVGQMVEDLLEVWQQLRFERLLVPVINQTHEILQAVGVDIIQVSPRQTPGCRPAPMRGSEAARSARLG